MWFKSGIEQRGTPRKLFKHLTRTVILSDVNFVERDLNQELFLASMVTYPPLELCRYFDFTHEWETVWADISQQVHESSGAQGERQPRRALTLHNVDEVFKKAKGQAGLKTNLSAADVLSVIKGVHIRSYKRLMGLWSRQRDPWTNAAVANWSLAIANAFVSSDEVSGECLITALTRLLDLSHVAAAKCAKSLHNLIRRTCMFDNATLEPMEYTRLMYMDSLFSRNEDYPYSARDEILMRSVVGHTKKMWDPSKKVWSSELFDVEYSRCLKRTLRSLSSGAWVQPTFSDFWSQATQWVAAGSAPGYKVQVNFDGELLKMRPNKRLALEAITLEELMDTLAIMDPILHSRASVKLENGKNRALWNSAVKHYILSSYLLESFEKHAGGLDWYDSADGVKKSLSRKLERFGQALEMCDTFMWDYADFNINHGLDEQAQMWLEIGYICAEHAVDEEAYSDSINVATWVATAVLNTVMEDQTTGLIMRTVRSLLTGTRGTGFTNTINNGVYSELMDLNFTRMFGVLLFLSRVCRGDDMHSKVRHWLAGWLGTTMFTIQGTPGQDIKVMYALGTGEYLRETIDCNGVRYSANRAIAGLINGEYAPVTLNDMYDKARAHLDQMELLRERGLAEPFLAPLLGKILRNKCKLVFSVGREGVDKQKHVITVDLPYLCTSQRYGGLGATPPFWLIHSLGELQTYRDVPSRPKYTTPKAILDQLHGVRSAMYRKDLYTSGYPIPQIDDVVKSMVSANVGSALPSTVVSNNLYHYGVGMLEWTAKLSRSSTQRRLASNPPFKLAKGVYKQLKDAYSLSTILFDSPETSIKHTHGVLTGLVAASKLRIWEAAAPYFSIHSSRRKLKEGVAILAKALKDEHSRRKLLMVMGEYNMHKSHAVGIQWLIGDLPFDDLRSSVLSHTALAVVRDTQIQAMWYVGLLHHLSSDQCVAVINTLQDMLLHYVEVEHKVMHEIHV